MTVLEHEAGRWRRVHSELVECRTDRHSDSEITDIACDRLGQLVESMHPALVALEWVEYQGAERAGQIVRLGPLCGALRRQFVSEYGPSMIVTPTRTQVLARLGCHRSEDGDTFVRRLVKGSAGLATSHEVTAAAVAIVGLQIWRAGELVKRKLANRDRRKSA